MSWFGWGSSAPKKRSPSPPRGKKGKAADLQAMGIDPALFEDPNVEDEDYDEDGVMSIEAHAKALQPADMDHKAVDAAMRLASGLHVEDDVEVEITEDDLNDPSLLAELEDLDEDKPRSGETLASLQSKLTAETQKCLSLKRAGRTEEAQEVLLTVRDLQARVAKLKEAGGNDGNDLVRLEAEASGKPTRASSQTALGAAPAAVPPAAAPPRTPSAPSQRQATPVVAAQNQPVVRPPPTSQPAAVVPRVEDKKAAQMEMLKQRFEQYKAAYAQYKEAGDTGQAKVTLAAIKTINELSQAIQQGKPIDLSKVPPEPFVVIVPRLDEVEQQRLAAFAKLENEFTAQIKAVHEQAKKLKDSPLREDKQKAVDMYRRQKEMMEDLKVIIAARESGQPLPRHRYEVKQTQEELVFSHLRDYEMEVGVVRCLHLPVPKEIATVESYVYITFPYPKAETPQVIKSPSVTKSLDPVYNFVGKLEIERKKSFLRLCERKRPITFEIYHRKLLGRDVLLGKGELSLEGLINKCEVTELVDILKPTSRKATGGKLEVCLRLRTPLQGKDVRVREEKVLVLDPTAPGPVVAAPAPVPATTQPAQPESRSPTLPASPPSTPQPAVTAGPTAAAPKSPVPSTPPPKPAPKPAPASPQAGAPPFNLDSYEPDSVDNMISNNVLEEELRRTDLALKQSPKNEDLLDRKQQIQLKINMLQIQVETGLLTMEVYVQRLEQKIKEERAIAQLLVKSGNKEAAKQVLTRVKIMEKELTEGDDEEEEA